MIVINMETLENGENAMQNSVDQNKLDLTITEMDTNADESETKLDETSRTEPTDETKHLESKTNSNISDDVKAKQQTESNRKETDIETVKLQISKLEAEQNIDEAIDAKSPANETRSTETRSSSLSVSKDLKITEEEIKGESVSKEGRRKRRISSVQGGDLSADKNERVNKPKRSKSDSDKFCWRCHKEAVDSQCTACPRSWHRRCMGGGPAPTSENWICGECAAILKAENAETRSPAMTQLSVEQLCTLLKHVVGRMRDYPGSEPFWKAVDLTEVPNYLDYVVKPMDLSLLESNVRSKLYGSTEAFMADAKWIQHNCIVFNTCGGVYTDTSKLTNAARQIIKAARQEVSEIEACPDCYGHARNLPRPQPAWFVEPCRRPHPLVWAKLKGFPFWPAKAMSRVNGQGHVDVRFFGAHDRAWVSPRDLYLYSKDPPVPLPRKRKSDMDECVRELTRHCRKLEMAFGQFKFAPPKIQYNPRDLSQITLMLPNYDPFVPGNLTASLSPPPRRKGPLRKRSLILKKKSPTREALMNNSSDSANESTPRKDSESDCDKFIEAARIPLVPSTTETKTDQSKPVLSSKRADLQNEPQKLPANGISHKNKKPGLKRGNIIKKQGVEIQIENKNHSVSKGSDGHSSSENEIALDIRQSLKLVDDTSHEEKPLPLEIEKKSQKLQKNDIESLPESKIKLKNNQKINKNQAKGYKPKTRMVNQVIAERAKATAANQPQVLPEPIQDENSYRDQTPVASVSSRSISTDSSANLTDTIANSSCSSNNTADAIPNTIVNTNSLTAIAMTASGSIPTIVNAGNTAESVMTSILLRNNTPSEAGKRAKLIKDSFTMNEASAIIKQEPKEQHQHQPLKKESKARKSFLNKPPVFPQIPAPSPPKAPASPPDAMVYIPGHRTENESDHLLLPPEAGPLSAQLHRGGQDLARRMAQLMVEALAEAAQVDSNHPDNSEINQRATVHYLKLQIERMRWQHQQHLAELKHNTDLKLREMKASWEAERYRAIEETRREAEEERLRSIEETKRKQWCALCGNEALFYCCWNTAYCDYPCQQAHWSSHMRTCAQNPPPNTIITATANVNQQQNGFIKPCAPGGNIYTLQNGEFRLVPTTIPCPTIKAIKVQQH
ncbi:protein kinase C-binding protein 1 [Athalia rosae]|uniref:protein kinase C-binding protein 1 n=1 Tax=Athalia rosae TaxID=37344 RepID=UPI00203395BE|nr:protein kinase C-binding protein 1 [Athalia rosae]